MKILWDRKAHDTLEASTGRTVPLDPTTLGMTIREPSASSPPSCPYNMPIAMMSNKVGGALAAGNTVVVKPPEQAERRHAALRRAAQRGPPARARSTSSSGLGDVGDAMVRHVDVAKVTMTGSSPTARLIQAAAAETLTPAIFELGGKSPNIVLDDADLDAAAMGLTLASIFGFNAGPGLRRRLAASWCSARSTTRCVERMEAIAKGDRARRPRPSRARRWGRSSRSSSTTRSSAFIEDGPQGDRAALRWSPRRRARARPAPAGTGSSRRSSWPRTTRRASAGRRSSVRSASSSRSTPTTRRSRWPTTAATAWRRACGARTSPGSTGIIREIQSGNVWVNTYLQTRHEIPFGGIKESGYGHDETLEFSRRRASSSRCRGPRPRPARPRSSASSTDSATSVESRSPTLRPVSGTTGSSDRDRRSESRVLRVCVAPPTPEQAFEVPPLELR